MSERKDRFVLEAGEEKSLQTDRVVLVHGPNEEISIIKKIFNLFILDSFNEYLIAQTLNRRERTRCETRLWTRSRFHAILTNRRLTGDYIYNKASSKLKSKRVINPECEWVKYEGFLEPIISEETFQLAQHIIFNEVPIFLIMIY
ncbi:MAG: recombinase family protein [Enterobacter sp.]